MANKRKAAAATAAAIARQGGKARAKVLSPARRNEIAKKAAAARWDGTPTKTCWWILYGGSAVDPQPIAWSRDKAELRAVAATLSAGGIAVSYIEPAHYEPTKRIVLRRQFKPDAEAQVKALETALRAKTEEGGQS